MSVVIAILSLKASETKSLFTGRKGLGLCVTH